MRRGVPVQVLLGEGGNGDSGDVGQRRDGARTVVVHRGRREMTRIFGLKH